MRTKNTKNIFNISVSVQEYYFLHLLNLKVCLRVHKKGKLAFRSLKDDKRKSKKRFRF